MPHGYNHERTVPVETQYKVMQLIPDDRPWLDQVQQLLNEHAQEGSAHVSETARQVGETASAYYEQGREQIEHVGHYVEDHIRDKPLQSVLMAAGLGMLMAFLWKK